MDTVNVLVMAPGLGRDLSYVAQVDQRVRVLDGNDAYLAELCRQAGSEQPSQRGAGALLAQADVLLMGYPVLRSVVSRAPRLHWAHHTQAGVSNLWASDLWDSPVLLTSTRANVSATAIAEFAIAGALYFARGLFDASVDKRVSALDRKHYQMLSLRQATMGVVGLGGIGKEVARLARALGMRVVATRRSVQAPQRDVDGADLLLPAAQLTDLAAQSDFVAVCAQLTRESDGLINRDVFAAMKPTAVLINIARGEVVDEDALLDALRSRRIRGAVLDVYRGELAGKPPPTELMAMPQVLLAPHISGLGSTDTASAARELFRENLRRYLDGKSLINVVDRARGY